jgi:Fe-S-cluster containining protein
MPSPATVGPMTGKERIEPRVVAMMLLKATSLPDSRIFTNLAEPRYTTIDYYRMACQLLFRCHRCGTCCTTGDPIRLRPEDASLLAHHLKIPVNKALKKFTLPDPDRKESLKFKHIRPCKFYDPTIGGCKIYAARPWSCRIFPFLGIYGSDDQVKIHESCPGSVQTMNILTTALEEVRSDPAFSECVDPTEIRRCKEQLRRALEMI